MEYFAGFDLLLGFIHHRLVSEKCELNTAVPITVRASVAIATKRPMTLINIASLIRVLKKQCNRWEQVSILQLGD